MPEQVVILTEHIYREIADIIKRDFWNTRYGWVLRRIDRALQQAPVIHGWDYHSIPGLKECGSSSHYQTCLWVGDRPCPECQRRKE